MMALNIGFLAHKALKPLRCLKRLTGEQIGGPGVAGQWFPDWLALSGCSGLHIRFYCDPTRHGGMSTRLGDAVSAMLVALVVWTAGQMDGQAPSELVHPKPFSSGVLAAVALEVGFAYWPQRAQRLWRRPVVRFGLPVGLIGTTLAAGRDRGATPYAAVLGGLTGYFLLLLGILLNLIPEPATWFQNTPQRD